MTAAHTSRTTPASEHLLAAGTAALDHTPTPSRIARLAHCRPVERCYESPLAAAGTASRYLPSHTSRYVTGAQHDTGGSMISQSDTDLLQTLVALEHQAWQALSQGTGADFYERTLTPDALMVFPFGLLDREATIASLHDAPPWTSYQIDDPRVITLTDASAVLTYTATAQRADDAPYLARMTTVFVREPGSDDWLTAFHQQTPISETASRGVEESRSREEETAR